jgi:hypothetical protein
MPHHTNQVLLGEPPIFPKKHSSIREHQKSVRLARAYALQRDTAKAKTAYQDLFVLWKDAALETSHPEGSQGGVSEAAVKASPARLCAQTSEIAVTIGSGKPVPPFHFVQKK